MAKTWEEKMNPSGVPKTVKLEGEAAKKWGGSTMYISCPKEVLVLMANVPRGKLVTVNEIRNSLAKKHKTAITCPLTTGIFSWVVANYAAENKKNIPYWRTLKTGGEINPKYPGGVETQKKLLEKEGHKVTTKGKRTVVVDFEEKIARI